MVVISYSWKEFQKIDGVCKQDTHSQYTSVQYSLFTSAECASRALLKGQHGSSHTDCSVIFVLLKKNLSSAVAHVSPFVVLSSLAYHEHIIFLIHSSFYHSSRTRSTIGTTRTTRRTTQYIMHISKLSQSTSCAIKNHSGVKTCRVAETCARQPHR